jgi:hypothetical protein
MYTTTTNPYFNSVYPGTSTEQNLIDSLVIEQIAMFGADMLYLPRKMLNLDKLLHESSKNAFEFAMPIPLYVKTFSGYNNGLEMLTKFGVRSSDEVTLVASRSVWNTSYAPFMKSYYNAEAGREPTAELNYLEGETARPKEGDIIYFPFDDSIFEIKYVMFDQPFFQLGKGYVYELMCEKFEYSGETFSTGYEEVDETDVAPDYYRMQFDLEADGTNTFLMHERVTIYDASEVSLMTEGLYNMDADVTTEDGESKGIPLYIDYQVGDNTFRLYKDPGFLETVPKIEATVFGWNKKTRKLEVGDLTNLDPDQQNKTTLDVDVNKFDIVVIEGQVSGSRWVSLKANEREAAFNDNQVIQQEFDEIKLIDDHDENPFGFV